MSYLPKGIPGTSFSAYLSQEKKKERQKEQKWREKYQGVFQDVEAQAEDVTSNHPYPGHQELLQKIKTALGPGAEHLKLVYRGTIDARVMGQPYPYGEKEGYFYIVEYGGSLGNHPVVKPGDVLVRFDGFASDWTLVAKEEPHYNSNSATKEDYDVALKVTQKHLKLLKEDLKKMPGPKIKAAPGPQKRKVILEDDED